MNASLLLPLVLLAGPVAAPQAVGPAPRLPALSDRAIADYKAATSAASAAIQAHRTAEALRQYKKASAIHGGNDGLWYNLACTQALLGRSDDALASLRRASEAGWSDGMWPQKDSDLASLQALPAFQEWIASLEPHDVPATAEGVPTTDPEAIPRLAEEAQAKIDRLGGVIGGRELDRAASEVRLWRAASWDAVAAARTGASRADAEVEALRALTTATGQPRWPALTDDVLGRASHVVETAPGTAAAASAQLVGAVTSYTRDVGEAKSDEDRKAAEVELERRLLVLVASNDDGPSVRSALVRLVDLGSDTVAQRQLYARLTRLVPDAAERKTLVTDVARGAWFRMEGLPAFEARTLDGRVVSPSSLQGKVTLLDFWATWCGPCREELPGVRDAWKKYQGTDFQVVGISLDRAKDGDATEFLEWCTEHDVTWPQVFDGKHWDAAVAKAFGVRSIPFPLLIDRDGRVIATDDDLRGDKLVPTLESAIGEETAVGAQ